MANLYFNVKSHTETLKRFKAAVRGKNVSNLQRFLSVNSHNLYLIQQDMVLTAVVRLTIEQFELIFDHCRDVDIRLDSSCVKVSFRGNTYKGNNQTALQKLVDLLFDSLEYPEKDLVFAKCQLLLERYKPNVIKIYDNTFVGKHRTVLHSLIDKADISERYALRLFSMIINLPDVYLRGRHLVGLSAFQPCSVERALALANAGYHFNSPFIGDRTLTKLLQHCCLIDHIDERFEVLLLLFALNIPLAVEQRVYVKSARKEYFKRRLYTLGKVVPFYPGTESLVKTALHCGKEVNEVAWMILRLRSFTDTPWMYIPNELIFLIFSFVLCKDYWPDIDMMCY